jgi:hypothetical protein
VSDLRERLYGEIEDAAVTFYGPSEEPLAEVAMAATDRALGHVAAWLRELADEIDRGPTFPLPPSVISALVRERADAIDPQPERTAT